ncbi:MAG: hypothetical protein AAGA77_06880 [Bacteroidota bacterium]
MNDLILGDAVLSIDIIRQPMSAVSSSWSKKANLKVGLELLSGFFKGFGMDVVGLKSSFEKA